MGFLIIDDHPLFGEALGNAIRISHLLSNTKKTKPTRILD